MNSELTYNIMQRSVVLILAACFVGSAVLFVQGTHGDGSAASSDYDLSWHTIDGGGGTSSGSGFELSGTIGQPDAGAMSGGNSVLVGGFWAGDPGFEPAPLCPGDLTNSGEVNVDDLLLVLNNWGSCPGGEPGCPGDATGSGEVNVDDLLIVLNNWGTCP